MQGFKIKYSQICEHLRILGNIPSSDLDTRLQLGVTSIAQLRCMESVTTDKILLAPLNQILDRPLPPHNLSIRIHQYQPFS